ncbi:MAG: hypothetical protein L0Y39_13300 [Methylococcaceae bacterium]|nr:hypothetical protein [Methylococcaceae bacterium]
MLVIAGSWILVFGIPAVITKPEPEIKFEKVSELSPGTPGFPVVESHFPIRRIDRIAVSSDKGHPFPLDVAYYRNRADQPRQALIFLPAELTGTSPGAITSDLNSLRWQAWLDASQRLRDPASGNKLFMSWWDNAQRIDLLSGAKTWLDAPVGEAFEHRQLDFWRHVSGGFGQHSERSKQLATWFLSDAEQALQAIEKAVDQTSDLFFVVTIDDLARLSEMRALSGKPAPFETRVFHAEENLHRLISSVKRWVREKGNGSYLVQYLAGSGARIWRITSVEGERTLLARLLPFTSSLAKPLENLELVHRSDWSAYLSIYRFHWSGKAVK